jgi:hypothetical protein
VKTVNSFVVLFKNSSSQRLSVYEVVAFEKPKIQLTTKAK